MSINPYFTSLGDGGKQGKLQSESFIRDRQPSKIAGDIFLNTEDGASAIVQIEGVELVPFSAATAKNDLPMFSQFQYCMNSPDGTIAAQDETLSTSEAHICRDLDRIAYWFARNASENISADEREELLPHFRQYLN